MFEIIAELSGCHGGKFDIASELIVDAASAGFTGVKFQCFEPVRLAELRSNHPRLNEYTRESLVKLYKETHTPREWFPELIEMATEKGLTWHASAFDVEDVDFLETIDCPRYKISSFESNDPTLLDRVRSTGKPVIISANQDENVYLIDKSWTVLHATNYGVHHRDAGLEKLRWWARDKCKFPQHHWDWGLSDHTTTSIAGDIATVLGASMIEWHIKSESVYTPDHVFAWYEHELHRRIRRIKEIRKALYGQDRI